MKIDFKQLVENIRYFYRHRGNTRVYIKIIDYMLKTREDERLFYEIFEEICDDIAIEHLTPTVKGIDYAKIANCIEKEQAQNGGTLVDSNICPQPFYLMQINPDGNVVPCCSMHYPGVFGSVEKERILDIWQGKKLNAFRCELLKGNNNANSVCKTCNLYLYGMYKEDILDPYKYKLSNVYNCN